MTCLLLKNCVNAISMQFIWQLVSENQFIILIVSSETAPKIGRTLNSFYWDSADSSGPDYTATLC